MGYSCSLAASYSLEAIQKLLCDHPNGNRLTYGGHWERGRENRDGAITGTVYKPHPTKEGFVLPAGSFRIEPSGEITRFPGISAKDRTKLLKLAYELCATERNESHAKYLYRNILSQITEQ